MAGTLAGEVAKGNAQIKEQADTIRALSHGDVEELVAQGMAQHQTGFDEFTGYVKRILMIAGILLGVIWPYLFSWLNDVQKMKYKEV